jgi:hypothetical protein
MNNKNKYKYSEMEITCLTFITGFITKIGTLFSSIWAWVGAVLISLIAFFAPLSTPLLIITALVLTDLACGLYINRHKIMSNKLRLTVVKMLVYLLLITSVFAIEFVIGISLIWKLVFGIIAFTELWSVSGNLLVIFPNLVILKSFKKILQSEIEKKVGETGANINVEEMLNEKEKIENKKAGTN